MKWLFINKIRDYYGKSNFRSDLGIDEIKKQNVLNNLKKSSRIDKDVQQFNEKLWNKSECLTIR